MPKKKKVCKRRCSHCLLVLSVEMEPSLVRPFADEDYLFDEKVMVERQANVEESLNGILSSLSYLC